MIYGTCRCCFNEFVKYSSRVYICNVCEARRKRTSWKIHHDNLITNQREKDVYQKILRNCTNCDISDVAHSLQISPRTAKKYVEILIKKSIVIRDENDKLFV